MDTLSGYKTKRTCLETYVPLSGFNNIFDSPGSLNLSDSNQEEDGIWSDNEALSFSLISEDLNSYEGHTEEHNGLSLKTSNVCILCSDYEVCIHGGTTNFWFVTSLMRRCSFISSLAGFRHIISGSQSGPH